MHILCLGTSYTGRYAAVNFSRMHSFYFLSRKPGFYKNLSYFDANKHTQIDCILDTVPPPLAEMPSGQAPKPAYFEEVQKLLERKLGRKLERKAELAYVYISSTAIFPSCLEVDDKTNIFNEESQALPETERGQRRLQSEIRIRQYYPQAKILRSTGIYGPGRSLVEQFQAANFSRAKHGNRLVSRVHVHDLLRLAFVLGQEPQSPSLVHAVDQRTVGYKEIFSFLEKEFAFSIPGDWRHATLKGRIIQSLHAKKLLTGGYRFPSYREGFSALLPKQT